MTFDTRLAFGLRLRDGAHRTLGGQVDKNVRYFLYLATIAFLLNTGLNTFFSVAAERQVRAPGG